MAISDKKERDLKREEVIAEILTILADSNSALIDDVMQIKSNEFCFPVVGCNGTELFAKIAISIPTGSKDEPFDGYALAQDYLFKLEEDKRKAEERAAAKEAKKKRDEEIRRKRAENAEKNGQ